MLKKASSITTPFTESENEFKEFWGNWSMRGYYTLAISWIFIKHSMRWCSSLQYCCWTLSSNYVLLIELITQAQKQFRKNERIWLQKKWLKQGHRIDDADHYICQSLYAYHYYFWDQSYYLDDSALSQCRKGLISDIIVIGISDQHNSIVNPMPLFPCFHYFFTIKNADELS